MHLTDTQIALFVEKKLTPVELMEVKSHISQCSGCTEKLAEVYKLTSSLKVLHLPEINADILQRAENIVTNKSAAKNRIGTFKLKYALSGIILFLAASVVFLLFRNEPVQTKFRSGNNNQSTVKLIPPNEAALGKNELSFSWSSIPGSIAYRFLLFEENGTPVSSSLLKDTSFTIPGSVNLINNTKYLWRVEIIFPDETKERSELNAFNYSE